MNEKKGEGNSPKFSEEKNRKKEIPKNHRLIESEHNEF